VTWLLTTGWGLFVAGIDATSQATTELARVIDVTETVEIRPVDPLDDTVELPVYDPDTPLYWSIPAPKRPAAYRLESFTQGWTTERLAEIVANGRPQ
jgi:hypothetical protein